jgi:7-carboxy-7-deazaguanine synthase
MEERQMRVHSIFQSINGEVTPSHQGSFCTFVRLQGCSLRCSFCDTKDSIKISRGMRRTPESVLDCIKSKPIKTNNITITGGEPLLQEKELLKLFDLLSGNYHVTLETNGNHIIPTKILYYLRWYVVMDIKPISAGIKDYDSYLERAMENASRLGGNCWIKFPIMDKIDFVHAVSVKDKIKNPWPKIAFSAVLPLTPSKLYTWMFKRRMTDVVLNVQLHKLIGAA